MAEAIEAAYRGGACFDAWDETFRYSTWLEAFRQAGINPADYAHRERPAEEFLPWSHIHMGNSPDQLWRQYEVVLATLNTQA